MTSLPDLIARVEKASGSDRRIDALVEIAIYPDRKWIIGQKPGRFPQEAIWGTFADFLEWASDETKDLPEINAPKYSASLDAVMSVVPEGMIPRRYWTSKLVAHCWEVSRGPEFGGWTGYSDHSSVLALLAAALRARNCK